MEPLPLVQLGLQPAEGTLGSRQGGADGLGMLPPLPASSGAATGLLALRLLQGQVYAGQLTVTNIGKVPVAWGSANVR